MTSQLAARLGAVEPQIVHLPPDVHSLAAAEEAIELADAYGVAGGFPLDEAQKFTLRAALGERQDGSWAAATICDFEPRQNGKNDSIAARELAGLVMFDEQLLIHTAHEFATANESFLRLVAVLENWDDLRRKVQHIYYANGAQSIHMKTGQRLLYKARSGGGVRGFAKADLVVYDEAQHVQPEHLAASGPARLANPNAQSWYAGSGGLVGSQVAWRFRRQALEGNGGRFAYMEHTAEKVRLVDGLVVSERPDVFDRVAWAQANPAYGRRISDESMFALYTELGAELFARECLCVWDAEPGDNAKVFSAGLWKVACSSDLAPGDARAVAVDVNPERTWSSIAVSDADGRVELVERHEGTSWVVSRAQEIAERWSCPVAFDPTGPAGTFRNLFGTAEVVEVAGRDFAQACGQFYDDIVDGRAQIRAHPALDDAVRGARKRLIGDSWVWARKDVSADVSPLIAVTLARWAARHRGEGLVFAY
jgi:hypothetical protein